MSNCAKAFAQFDSQFSRTNIDCQRNATVPYTTLEVRMAKCNVRGCRVEPKGDTSIYYHYLRKNEPEDVKRSWREFCQTDKIQLSVCSRHFTKDDYVTCETYRKSYPNAVQKLKPGAIPSIPIPKPLSYRIIRQAKKQHDEMKKVLEEILNESDDDSSATEMQNDIDALEEVLAAHDIKPPGEEPAIEMAPEHVQMELEPDTDYNPLENEAVQIKTEELDELTSQIQRLRREKLQLKQEMSVLQSNNEQLMKIKREKETMEEILQETFSQNELDLLLKRKAHVVWRRKEMEEAFLIRYLNKTCYRYLRRKKRYPLPSSAAILKWANQYGIKLRVLNDIEPDSD